MFKRILIISCLTTISVLPTYSTEYQDLTSLHDASYRVGTTDTPEIKTDFEVKIKTTTARKVEDEENISTVGMTYADLSIKKMSRELAKTIEGDYDTMMTDLSILWQGAATRSDTVKYALYKLSNPDKDKPTNTAIKNVLQTIAGMSTLVGAGTGNALLSCASLIGGNTLGIMSQDTKALNYKYTKVGDADMIILVRKVDDLQQKVVNVYYDYLTTRKIYDLTSRMVQQRYTNYRAAQNSAKDVLLVTDSFYRDAIDQQIKARGDFYEKRSMMEQLVGHDTFVEFEKIINKRLGEQDETIHPLTQTEFQQYEAQEIEAYNQAQETQKENMQETNNDNVHSSKEQKTTN